MRTRKTTAILLTFIIALSFVVPAAASGYAGGAVPAAPTPVTQAQVSDAVNNAISQFNPTSGQASAALYNASTVYASALQNAFTQVAASGVDNLIFHADSVETDGTISARVYIDAATAAMLPTIVNLSISTKGEEVDGAVRTFTTYFTNTIVAVNLGQRGSFGTYVAVAARVNLSGLNTSNLMFYAYDKAANTYSAIFPQYTVGNDGYLYFSTPLGGDIIITDRELTLR